MENELIVTEMDIKAKIYTIRGLQVMLDEDLAILYDIETRVLNQAIKRNIERFPVEFMFQLTEDEYKNLVSQIVIASLKHGGRRLCPYAFTEQGVAMLSAVLKSDTAVKISISIIKAFVSMRRFIVSNAQIFQRLDYIDKKQIEHDEKINQIFNAIETREIKPDKGIFFDGQVFDTYKFISDLIRSAKTSIILFNNYIDDTVLTLFSKRNEKCQSYNIY